MNLFTNLINKKKSIYIIVSALIIALEVSAQEEKGLEINVEASLVSSYVWRGLYQSGASLQPSLSASISGFTLEAWGSKGFSSAFKEFDFLLSFETGGLTLGVNDYWAGEQGTPYFDYKEQHLFEGSLSYHFGEKFPLTLGWNTMFFGDQDKNENGKRMFSSYFMLGYDFSVKTIECNAEVGFNPWESIYHENFNVINVSLKASKKVTITNKFSLPLFVQAIFSPATNDVHLVFGITF